MPSNTSRKTEKKERAIQDAIAYYNASEEHSIRASGEKFGVAYSTLRGRLGGAQDYVKGHRRLEALTEYEEKAIVRWCAKVDEWGHPATLSVVKGMAQAMVQRRVKEKVLGKHWLSRFLSRNKELTSKLSTRLDHQRAFASNPVILCAFFQKVITPFYSLL